MEGDFSALDNHGISRFRRDRSHPSRQNETMIAHPSHNSSNKCFSTSIDRVDTKRSDHVSGERPSLRSTAKPTPVQLRRHVVPLRPPPQQRTARALRRAAARHLAGGGRLAAAVAGPRGRRRGDRLRGRGVLPSGGYHFSYIGG